MFEPFTHDQLAEVLRVDGGTLYWRVSRGPVRAGAVAGCVDLQGYVVVSFKKRQLLAHRVVWLLTYGAWPAAGLDHIDGNRANNHPSNLREATASQNQHNRKAHGAIPLKGVCLNASGKFQATCGRNYLGQYLTAEEAARAYDAAASKKYGRFARLNFGGNA